MTEINQNNEIMKVGVYVQLMNTDENKQLGIASFYGRLMEKLNSDEFGNDVYVVRYKILGEYYTCKVCTASMNIADIENICMVTNNLINAFR